jgi:hypothetical protein
VRMGGTQQYAIERRSDGTYRVSASDGQDGGLTAGLGFALGGGVHVGVDGTAAVTFTGGKSWELPDEAALDSFLARVQSRYDLGKDMTEFMRLVPPPAERYASTAGDATGELAAELASKKHSTKPLGEEAGLRTAIGTRTGGGGKVWYLEAGAELSGALGDVVPALGGKGGLLVEWRTGDRPSVTLRKAARQGTRTTETVVRLPLARDDDLLSASRSTLALLSGPTAKLAGRDFAQRVRARPSSTTSTRSRRTPTAGTTGPGWGSRWERSAAGRSPPGASSTPPSRAPAARPRSASTASARAPREADRRSLRGGPRMASEPRARVVGPCSTRSTS